MSYQDIVSHLKERYDFDVSAGTISAVTDKLLPLITDWRSRPLEAIYPILFLDGMYFKSRENGKVITKVIYNILGINQEGYKDILGFYVAERSEEHTSELQSLMRISYAVFCLKKKQN